MYTLITGLFLLFELLRGIEQVRHTDRPRRSVLRCSVIFYIRHGFDGNGSAQSIFASMFCHSDVRLRY